MLYSVKRLSSVVLLLLSSLLVTGCQPSSSKPVTQWRHATEGARAAIISDDAKYSVVSTIHHGISVWDLDKNALLYTWSQKQDNADNLVLAVAMSNDNSHVLTASRENFALWDLQTGDSVGYWQVRDSNIRDIAVANEGRFVLIGKANNVVVHVNMENGRRLEFLGHQEKINSVDMHPNGRVAISGGNDFVAYVWDTQTGQVIHQFNHPSRVTKVAIDPKGRYAFTADSQKEAIIWDLKSGEKIANLHYTNRQEVFSSVRFSDDGQYLVTGAPTRKVSLWQLLTGKRLQSWRVSPREDIHPAGAVVYSVAFSDNNTILTESSSGLAEQWQITK